MLSTDPRSRISVARVVLLLAAVAVACVVVGCTGNDASAPTNQGLTELAMLDWSPMEPFPAAETGGWTLTVRWPEPLTRLVPAASNSVRVVITAKGTGSELANEVLTREGPEATVDALPVGLVCIITASAHPDVAALETAQASCSIEREVLHIVEKLKLTMDSTITRVAVRPGIVSLAVGETAQLTRAALNADGEVVLVGDTWREWESEDDGIAAVDANGLVTAVALGSTVITARDDESGVAGTALIRVGADVPVLAFNSNRRLGWMYDLYTIRADGSNVQPLLTSGLPVQYPIYSDDGSKLVFVGWPEWVADIYTMNADGTGVTRLTSNNPVSDTFPDWSPDGTKIVFSSRRYGWEDPVWSRGGWELCVMDADGGNVQRLTDNPDEMQFVPRWSPDGTKILFTRDLDGDGGVADHELWTIEPATGIQTMIVSKASWGDWSPDGSRITYCGYGTGWWEIYAADADGSNAVQLTTDYYNDWYPAWSPDGGQIAFHSDRSGNWDVWVTNADGSGLANVTDNAAHDYFADWAPLGAESGYEIEIE